MLRVRSVGFDCSCHRVSARMENCLTFNVMLYKLLPPPRGVYPHIHLPRSMSLFLTTLCYVLSWDGYPSFHLSPVTLIFPLSRSGAFILCHNTSIWNRSFLPLTPRFKFLCWEWTFHQQLCGLNINAGAGLAGGGRIDRQHPHCACLVCTRMCLCKRTVSNAPERSEFTGLSGPDLRFFLPLNVFPAAHPVSKGEQK